MSLKILIKLDFFKDINVCTVCKMHQSWWVVEAGGYGWPSKADLISVCLLAEL